MLARLRLPTLLASSAALTALLWSAPAYPCSIAAGVGPSLPSDGARAVLSNSKMFVTLYSIPPDSIEAELHDPRGTFPVPLTLTPLAPDMVMLDLPMLDPGIEYLVQIVDAPGRDPIRISFLSVEDQDLQPPVWSAEQTTLDVQTEEVDGLPPCGDFPGYRTSVEFPIADDQNLAAYVLYVQEEDSVRALTSHLARPGDQSPLQLNAFSSIEPSGCFFVEAIDIAGQRVRGEGDCATPPAPPEPPIDPPMDPPVDPPMDPPMDPDLPKDLETVEPGCGCTGHRPTTSGASLGLLLLGALALRPRKRTRLGS